MIMRPPLLCFIFSTILPCFCHSSSYENNFLENNHPSSNSVFNHHSAASTCEEIKVPLCRGLEYNMTSMPNQLNHANQDEAGMEAHQFFPLVAINCSSDLRFFVCSMYTPICLPDYPKPLPPCRSVCERAKRGCAPLMLQYGFRWPAHLECSTLPVYGGDELCMDANHTTSSKHGHYSVGEESTPAPPPPLIEETPPLVPTPRVSEHYSPCRCSCPDDDRFKTVRGPAAARVFAYNVSGCTYACRAVQENDERDVFVRFWLALWACVCYACTLLTVCTFLIDRSRFQYPERPIIYLAFCYLMVSSAYLIRLMVGHDKIACEGDRVRTATTGPTQCTTVFLLIYFFGMASNVWWVILSFNWFLAAGLKWSTEAIAGYTTWFHFFAWAVPAVLTISVLSTSSVDGDPFAGVCYVGSTDVNALRLFVLSPLFSCLAVGSFFLLAGFVSLFRIRNLVKNQRNGVCRIERLEKLMVRIGIFSVLYTVPATVVLACHFYEQYYRKFWEASAVCRGRCFSQNNVYSIAHRNANRQSEYYLFIVKYFTCLLVGISSGIWIWTKKTWSAWKNFLTEFFCCCSTAGVTRPSGYGPTEAIIIKSHTDLSNGLYNKHYHPMKHV